MKKRILSLLLACVLVAGGLFAAAPRALALDLPDAYSAFLQELRVAIRDKGMNSPDRISQRMDGANVSAPVQDYLRCIWSDSQNDDLYQTRFALRDLDGNGVPELLLTCGKAQDMALSAVGVTVKNDLDLVYTVRNGAIVTVADFDYRDEAAVYGNVILNHGSGGAMYYGCSFKTLPMNGTQLNTVAEYDIVYETDPPQFYRNYFADRSSRITVEQARAMHQQYMTGAEPDWIGLFDNTFVDVAESDWYYSPVQWASATGITMGTSSDLFSPNATCTRGQVVTFLWRAMGEPEPTSAENPFRDVHTGDYYFDAVRWAVEQGITQGTGDGAFSPDAPCTRGHVVTFLWRAKGSPAATGGNPFDDVPSGMYYSDAVLWAVTRGITQGTSETQFSPEAPCTRAQVVTFLYRDLVL